MLKFKLGCYKLVLAIFHHRHASFLGHDLNWAYPLTMQNRIDDFGILELEVLFPYHLSHSIFQPSLKFPRRCYL